MNKQLKRIALTAIATLGLCAGIAQAAGDIEVINTGSKGIHPYFRSNCWFEGFNNNDGASDWQFFGYIGPRSQFNWNEFHLLLDPKCKNPVIKFTYVHPGEAAPSSTDVERTVLIQYDATENRRIVLGDKVVVISNEAR